MILGIIVFVLIALSGKTSLFYQRKAEGWHWYEERSKKEESLTPSEQVEGIKGNLNQLLNQAILDPTEKNVILYRKAQEAWMERSHEFARMWEKMTILHPELDYTLKFPTQHTARLIFKEEESKKKDQVLKDLSKTYGLFYFFKGECRYCEAFGPIVKSFAEKYGWDILAVSMDGSKSQTFPKAQSNNGIIETLKIEIFPTLMAVHPETGEMIPLSYGLTSLTDIENRAYALKGNKS